MSHLRTISLINKGKHLSAPIPRPAKPGIIHTEIEVVLLENPPAEDIAKYRSSGWRVVYENFTPLSTSNGIKGHHFIRLEKIAPISSAH